MRNMSGLICWQSGAPIYSRPRDRAEREIERDGGQYQYLSARDCPVVSIPLARVRERESSRGSGRTAAAI